MSNAPSSLARVWLAATASLLLLSCTPGSPPVAREILVVALETPPLQMDPRFATDANSSFIGDLVFAGLTRASDAGQYLPSAAARWEMPDARTYVFHLRRDFVFHDGTPLTAADVKATYESILDPDVHSPKRTSLGPVVRVEAPDEWTVRIELAEPFAPFMESTGLPILPARQIAGHGTHPIAVPLGAGPFRLQGPMGEDSVALQRHDAYPLGTPHLPGILFRVVPDAVVRLLELRRGTVDLVQNAIEPQTLDWARRQRHLAVLTAPGTTAQYLGMNLRHPALADPRVRQALAYAIDRSALIDTLLNGLATPATGLLSPTHWAYAANVATYTYNPKRAMELLDAAGLVDPDGDGPAPRLKLSYKTSAVDLRRRIAEAIQEQLRLVGIELEVRSYEWGTFYADIRGGNFHLYSLAWVGINDPDIYYLTCHSSQVPPQGNNRGFFSDPTVDALTERARHTVVPAERERLYVETQQRVAQLLPVIPLWWQTQVAVVNRRVHGFQVRPNGSLHSLAEAWIE